MNRIAITILVAIFAVAMAGLWFIAAGDDPPVCRHGSIEQQFTPCEVAP